MKILVLGCNGQLGRCLQDQLDAQSHEIIFSSRKNINIENFQEAKKKILDLVPDIVINASAYTSVDRAETDQKKTNAVNHLAVKNLADVCKLLNSWLIHISTDYVFDGSSDIPYKEDDFTNPKGVYAHTKLNGELSILTSECKYIILRTSWVFSEYGKNFLTTMLRLGSQQDEMRVVVDQIGCPTYAQDLAKTINYIVELIPSNTLIPTIYHYSGDKPTSWYHFAQIIFKEAQSKGMKVPNEVYAIKTSAYPSKAPRPASSAMNSSKIKKELGIDPCDWKQGISSAIEGYIKRNSPE